MENGLPEADPPDEFDEYTLVLLYRGTNPPVLDDDESDRLQRQHLGHLQAMKRQGALLINGPFSDQPDETCAASAFIGRASTSLGGWPKAILRSGAAG